MTSFLASTGELLEPFPIASDWKRLRIGCATIRCPPDTPLLYAPEGPLLVVGELFDRTGSRVHCFPSGAVNAIVTTGGRWLMEGHWGRYILVFQDPADGAECVARDPSGALPVFVEQRQVGALLYSDLDLVPPSIRARDIDPIGLAHHLWYGGLPSRRSAITGVSELLPGAMLRLARGDPTQLWRPWPTSLEISDGAERVRAAVDKAVRGLCNSRGDLMLQLSGGLDSSILAGCLADLDESWSAATIFTPAGDGDERRYARVVAARWGIPLDEIALTPDSLDLLAPPERPGVRPGGFGMLAALHSAFSANAKRRGAAALVSGTGGDNVFCSLRTAAPILDAWAIGGASAAAQAASALSKLTRTPITSAIAHALRYALLDRARPHRWRPEPLLLAPGSKPPIDHHPWLERPCGGLPGTRAHLASILRAQAVVASADRDRLFPLLAQPVLEACLSVPSFAWLSGGTDRAVARAAFSNQLPPEIVSRRSKGRLTSLLAPAYERDRARLETLLVDGMLAELGIIDPSAVRAAAALPAQLDERPSSRMMELADAELWARAVTGRT